LGYRRSRVLGLIGFLRLGLVVRRFISVSRLIRVNSVIRVSWYGCCYDQ
jgi:hypothetical protein